MSWSEEPTPATALWHAQSVADVETALATDSHGGLGADEARTRLQVVGENRLATPPRPGAWQRLWRQFTSPLIYVLVGAAFVTFLLGDLLDTIVIAAVVVANSVIGFIQEGRAERALEAVSSLLADTAEVIREGRRHRIDATSLVPGDLVAVSSGSKVPADARVVWQRGLSTDESALTGESLTIEKHSSDVPEALPLAERDNMIFQGTMVVTGEARAIVVHTGDSTELGRIGQLVDQVGSLETPLSRRLAVFANQVTLGILLLAALSFTWGYVIHDYPWFELFLAAVGIAVAAIPEGLPAIVTIVLALGTRVMARRGVLIRRLPAVETLGSVSLIWTDKTGTLTTNEMTVVDLVTDSLQLEVKARGPEQAVGLWAGDHPIDLVDYVEVSELMAGAILCNRAEVHSSPDGEVQLVGDPLETALLQLAEGLSLKRSGLMARYPIIDTVPFESERRYMATQHDDSANSRQVTWLKGAPERVIELAQASGAAPAQLEGWNSRADELARRGRRVIAIARSESPEFTEDSFPHLRIIGLIGVIDPPRPEAQEAISACQAAGITVKMITGDHGVTASVIGTELGLRADQPLLGQEIDFLDDHELVQRLEHTDVIARANPQHKLRLVQLSQSGGERVAMTGDGVNDAPALQQADIGVAMGRNGTDAARDASDVVITDDRFETIQHAVFSGRVVFDNIKKALLFILPTNLGEAGVIVLALLVGATLPITASQILWVNLVTALTLALALVGEPAEPGVMSRNPRPSAEPLLTARMLGRIGLVGALLMGQVFLVFSWHLEWGGSVDQARTAAVSMLVIAELFYLFNVRWFTRNGFHPDVFRGNLIALIAPVVLVGLQLLFVYSPGMNAFFGSAPLPATTWGLIVALALGQFAIVEIEKALWRSSGRYSF